VVLRPTRPNQGKTAVAAAALVLAGWFTAPVLAAPDRDILCDEDPNATLEVSTTELIASPVSSSEEVLEDHLLKPRVEAAAREVFSSGEDDTDTEDVESLEETEVSEPRIHRMSDGEPRAYKRQMYRRDI